MISNWFLKEGHTEFRGSLEAFVTEAAQDLCRPDARNTLGDEHDQCQHLFTKLYTLLASNQRELTRCLLCCSKIPEPILILRYYRSRVRRRQGMADAQFIESETGADFALCLQVDLPGMLQTQRMVLGQAKILDRHSSALNDEQLGKLLAAGGPEAATYLVWGSDIFPTVVSAENIASFARTQRANRLTQQVVDLGKPLSEFICDAFLSLWFGREYRPEKEGESPPPNSIGVLYHFLHAGPPPPNVVFLGLTSSNRLVAPPGVYVEEMKTIS